MKGVFRYAYSNLSLLDYTLAGKDFNNDPIQVIFQPGESQHNICVVIIDDDIREGNEKFRLLLSIPYSVRALGVWPEYPYYADVVITGTCVASYSICMFYICICSLMVAYM